MEQYIYNQQNLIDKFNCFVSNIVVIIYKFFLVLSDTPKIIIQPSKENDNIPLASLN
jgi:hypothetical protein